MLTAVFLGDSSVNAPAQIVKGDTIAELKKAVETVSAKYGVNPANWYGDGYQSVSSIPAESKNNWARNAFSSSTTPTAGSAISGNASNISGSSTSGNNVNSATKKGDQVAIYLGGNGIPYTVITGTGANEISEKAISLGINPNNLYGNNFKSVLSLPSGNDQALEDLKTSIGTTIYNQVKANWQVATNKTDTTTNKAITTTSPTKTNYVTEEQIQEIYRQYAGRDATAEEIAWHTQSHPISYDDLLNWAKTAPEVTAEKKLQTEQKTGETTTGTTGGTTGTTLKNVYLGDNEGRPYQIIPGNTQTEINANATALGINPSNLQVITGNTWEEIQKAKKTEEDAKAKKEEEDKIKAEEEKTKLEEEKAKKLSDALAIIDASDLPADQKELWKEVVKNYPEGVEVDPTEILNTFKKIKEETIDPYFKEMTNLSMAELESNVESLNKARQLEMEQENINYGQNISSTKKNLEATGMTFTGEALKKLGDLSFYKNQGIEGEVPQAQRLLSTSTLDRYEEQLQNIGLSAEKYFGSSGVGGLVPGYESVGGITGNLKTQKESAYGSYLSQLINQKYLQDQTQLNLL